MTKTSMTLLALACLALSACGGKSESEGEGHAADTGHAATSSAGLPDGSIEAGKQLAATKGAATGQACVDCHGAEGNAPIDATYPRLGGQYADYIAHALQAYRDGKRAGSGTTDLMATQAKGLTDQQIADLAAYYGSVQGQLVDLKDAY
ncbi:MAG: c-type cytochrome [Thermomonas sp.]